jgi:hypothetical protein
MDGGMGVCIAGSGDARREGRRGGRGENCGRCVVF